MDLLGISSIDALRRLHRTWGKEAPGRAEQAGEGKWTKRIAAASRNFIEIIKGELGIKAKG